MNSLITRTVAPSGWRSIRLTEDSSFCEIPLGEIMFSKRATELVSWRKLPFCSLIAVPSYAAAAEGIACFGGNTMPNGVTGISTFA